MGDKPMLQPEQCGSKRESMSIESTHDEKNARIVHANIENIPLAGFHKRVKRIKGVAGGWLERYLFRFNKGLATNCCAHSCERELEKSRGRELFLVS